MNFCLRCVVLVAAALFWSTSTASAETYIVSASLTPSAQNARAKVWKMVADPNMTSSNSPIGTANMTAVNATFPGYPGIFGSYSYYYDHEGTVTTNDAVTAVTVQYEEPLGVLQSREGDHGQCPECHKADDRASPRAAEN